jgi:hypothetical protein
VGRAAGPRRVPRVRPGRRRRGGRAAVLHRGDDLPVGARPRPGAAAAAGGRAAARGAGGLAAAVRPGAAGRQ